MEKVDAFGRGLMGCLKGDESGFLIERDDGHTDDHDHPSHYFKDYSDFGEFERQSLEEVRGRILDVGCGAGRHCLYLEEKGYEVVGIDISLLAVEVCRKRGVSRCLVGSGLTLPFRDSTFDTILLMGNTFGLGGTMGKTREMLRDFHRVTVRGGIIVATSRVPEETDNPAHLRYHQRNRELGRPIGQVTIRYKYKDSMGEWFDYLMVNPDQMRKLGEETGWSLEKVFKEDSLYAAILKRG